ncbi:hypothetical protein MTR_3g452420 [Medicago truncatula]|uniref:Uncharacterized protein n=1 Tax=Medicago truncatula TaxID=3880 RepID=A0A072UXH9_MEDTR|nr:hypothetical protein MTR_3g452420 [Medicago truncatula]
MRRRRNSILALRVGDNWVESVHGIRAEVVDFIKGHFSDSEVDRPTLDGVPFNSILDLLRVLHSFRTREEGRMMCSFFYTCQPNRTESSS